MSSNYIPKRGDIVWLIYDAGDSNPEQSERKQALVISPTEYNKKTGLALFCPVKAKIKGYPFEVVIPDDLKTKGIILADQVKSLNWKIRDAEYICTLPDEKFSEVISKLSTLI
jgi:mRNA interferase MazF